MQSHEVKKTVILFPLKKKKKYFKILCYLVEWGTLVLQLQIQGLKEQKNQHDLRWHEYKVPWEEREGKDAKVFLNGEKVLQ